MYSAIVCERAFSKRMCVHCIVQHKYRAYLIEDSNKSICIKWIIYYLKLSLEIPLPRLLFAIVCVRGRASFVYFCIKTNTRTPIFTYT